VINEERSHRLALIAILKKLNISIAHVADNLDEISRTNRINFFVYELTEKLRTPNSFQLKKYTHQNSERSIALLKMTSTYYLLISCANCSLVVFPTHLISFRHTPNKTYRFLTENFYREEPMMNNLTKLAESIFENKYSRSSFTQKIQSWNQFKKQITCPFELSYILKTNPSQTKSISVNSKSQLIKLLKSGDKYIICNENIIEIASWIYKTNVVLYKQHEEFYDAILYSRNNSLLPTKHIMFINNTMFELKSSISGNETLKSVLLKPNNFMKFNPIRVYHNNQITYNNKQFEFVKFLDTLKPLKKIKLKPYHKMDNKYINNDKNVKNLIQQMKMKEQYILIKNTTKMKKLIQQKKEDVASYLTKAWNNKSNFLEIFVSEHVRIHFITDVKNEYISTSL
jgi:hypothetical protein